jgi:hypothetical protein
MGADVALNKKSMNSALVGAALVLLGAPLASIITLRVMLWFGIYLRPLEVLSAMIALMTFVAVRIYMREQISKK